MQTLVEQIVYISDMFGTAVFAFSGVLVAGRLRMDGFGVMVLAAVTAIGGGTIRDMILGPPRLLGTRPALHLGSDSNGTHRDVDGQAAPSHALVRAAGRRCLRAGTLYRDRGAKALNFGTSGLIAVLMGTMTGVAGGMIRDVLAGRCPWSCKRDLCHRLHPGGILYTLALEVNVDRVTAMLICMTAVFGLRVAAIYWHLSLPTFSLQRN